VYKRQVLVSGVGETPRGILEKAGVKPVEMGGFIIDGVKAIYEGGNVAPLQKRKKSCSSGGCVGSGGGCS